MERVSQEELRRLFAERLSELRQAAGLNVRELGEATGLSGASISRYENGKIDAKKTAIQALATYFKVNPVWLMGIPDAEKYLKIDEEPDYKLIPILGRIAAGQPILAEQHIEGYESVSIKSNATFCLKVKGDSMINARIHDGDIVFIKEQPDVENGEIAAVIIDGENATLKRIKKYPGTIVLHPENPAYEELTFTKHSFKDVKILGKCIAVKFWLE